MDVYLGGEGLSFRIDVETAQPQDGEHIFKVSKVRVNLKHLRIKLVKSKFRVVFALVRPFVIRALRPALQKAVERQLKQTATRIDVHAFNVRRAVKQAQSDFHADPSPENARSIYMRYATALKAELSARKKKTAAKADKAAGEAVKREVRLAMTQHDSLLPDVHLESGLSSRATEFADLAAKGSRWESPVFSLGSASETANPPKPAQPTRKSNQGRMSPGQQHQSQPAAGQQQHQQLPPSSGLQQPHTLHQVPTAHQGPPGLQQTGPANGARHAGVAVNGAAAEGLTTGV